MLTAMHMDSAAPWSLPAGRHGHLLYDLVPAPAAPPPPPPPPPPQPHHQPRPRAMSAAGPGRRISKRRPRPSRRLPTTYISADPADFRRMVHQVTGADDFPLTPSSLPPPHTPTPGRASSSSAAAAAGALLLPTLDTSAFLLGRPGPAAAQTPAQPCDASLPPPETELDGAAAAGAYNNACSSGSSSHCGFPTLESWDLL